MEFPIFGIPLTEFLAGCRVSQLKFLSNGIPEADLSGGILPSSGFPEPKTLAVEFRGAEFFMGMVITICCSPSSRIGGRSWRAGTLGGAVNHNPPYNNL